MADDKNKKFAIALLSKKPLFTARPKEGVGIEVDDKEDGSYDREPLLAAAKDLIEAVKKGDEGMVADALETAFMACEMAPHKEGPEIEEEEE